MKRYLILLFHVGFIVANSIEDPYKHFIHGSRYGIKASDDDQRITSIKASLEDWKDQFMKEVDQKVASIDVSLREELINMITAIDISLREELISMKTASCKGSSSNHGDKGGGGSPNVYFTKKPNVFKSSKGFGDF